MPIDPELLFDHEMDRWGYDWMSRNNPGWVDTIELLVQVKTPQQIHDMVLRKTQSADLARFAQMTATHARRVQE